ncbi:MAG: hypothetical protein LBF41_05605 [Deltaproteobacteria bacterium]|jgi:hypothetical protein|nr:hypothetical protein [Deltaproteobacteria bacterium]
MAQFYKSTNKLPLAALIGIPVSFAVLTSIFAVIYALGIWYCPIVYINALICFGWAFVSAILAGIVIKATKARFPFAVGLLALVGALVGYYVHWCVWLSLVANPFVSRDIGDIGSALAPDFILNFILHPTYAWDFAVEVNKQGVWTLGKAKTLVNGPFLTIIWGVEFLIYAISVWLFSFTKAMDPFSEETNAWYKKAKYKNNEFVAPDDPQEHAKVVNKIAEGDLSYFLDAPILLATCDHTFKLEIYSLPTSSVAYVTVSMGVLNKKGAWDYSALVTYMSVSRDITDEIVPRTQ